MQGFIETINGRYGGTTLAIGQGEVGNVGSKPGTDLFFPNDSLLAPLHFAVANEDNALNLQTFNNQVFVNNQPVKDTRLAHGDFILAGGTLFYAAIDGETASSETPLGKLIGRLRQIDRLSLLIDENTDNRIMPLIRESGSNWHVLKDEVKNLEGLTANPLVVEINKEYLEKFVRIFWGKGRLVFFEPRYSNGDDLVHFKLLLEKTQIENGVDLRFYDPRTLRTVLGEAEKKHAQYFFAGAKRYLTESQLPGFLFEFGWTADGVNCESTRLSDPFRKIPTQTEIAQFLNGRSLFGNFATEAKICLQYLLDDSATDFQTVAEKNLPDGDGFGLDSTAAKIQFVAVNAMPGEDLNFDKLFRADGFSSDEKLGFFVEKLNLGRG